ncbi:extracellular solute-binding protein [Nocardioides sp. zg-1228]|uniref:extracellular solute-binding protein n=1 Tax=Nocardioides sp. zg-1228 TaxID=2763008 RepID=UPI0016428773|nr:extracellular solute-binding protein [Nocardioides sp. zg-1228]MBC2932909.1 extracellular solute-binding protein [Nocardioides sp. zg-1228]QSF56887.1 extracellular solute-binding protein [Nocardioides sp. zg-1228]
MASLAALALAGGLLSACGGDSGKATLNWYVNPDGVDTFRTWAEKCSTDQYDIEVQQLPSSATDQRTQLARRLAAEDSSTDIMNLDPVFVAEFANAGWLQEVPEELATEITDGGDYLEGAADTVVWDDTVYAIPLWANTQVLWYRKSMAEAAGLDMDKPVTWDQIIDAAAKEGGTVGVQANRYEAYVVWINALMQGAGGAIITDTEAGRDATVELDTDAGREAAAIIEKLAKSSAAQPDLTVSNEGTSLGQMFPADGPGEFMVNWTFVYANYKGLIGKPGGPADEQEFEDLGWARYPETVEGEPSKPPIGGIDIGVGAYSEHPDWAMEAAQCITSTDVQVDLAINDGLMPSTNTAYDEVVASGEFPESLIELYRTSVDEGGPRPKSPFYSQISSAVQSVWHSPTSVNPDSTPRESEKFLSDVLAGRSLL